MTSQPVFRLSIQFNSQNSCLGWRIVSIVWPYTTLCRAMTSYLNFCNCDMQFPFADSRLTEHCLATCHVYCDLTLWLLINLSYLTVCYRSLTLAPQCPTFAYLLLLLLLCVRIHSVCLAASPWPLNQHVWISRCGTCFWAGRSCMYNEWSVKSVRRKATCMHYVESVFENASVFSNHTKREDMAIYQDDHMLYLLC